MEQVLKMMSNFLENSYVSSRFTAEDRVGCRIKGSFSGIGESF